MTHKASLGIGITLLIMGSLFVIGGMLKPDILVYRLLSARPALMWGDERKHDAVKVFGVLIIAAGIIMLVEGEHFNKGRD